MRQILALLLALGCADETKLSFECNAPCYTGPVGTMDVGECSHGFWACADTGLPTCAGQILPTEEECGSQFDFDCDGHIPQAKVEACNGVDDDCDGLVDELIDPVGVCYSGPLETLTPTSICRAGLLQCQFGTFQCVGAILPSSEVCNQLDDDCNGLVDDINTGEVQDIDALFLIDRSGSMVDELEEVRLVLQEMLTVYASSSYRYAFISVPGNRLHKPTPVVTSDFVTALDAQAIVPHLLATEGDVEGIYDALFMATLPGILSWRTGSLRHAIYFSDEEAQSAFGISMSEATEALRRGHITFSAFTLPLYDEGYLPIAQATGGQIWPLGLYPIDAILPLLEVSQCQ